MARDEDISPAGAARIEELALAAYSDGGDVHTYARDSHCDAKLEFGLAPQTDKGMLVNEVLTRIRAVGRIRLGVLRYVVHPDLADAGLKGKEGRVHSGGCGRCYDGEEQGRVCSSYG